MRHHFVPSYYARDFLNKMQRFQQGSQSVEDYYQELQKGMIRCGILEEPGAAMAALVVVRIAKFRTSLIIKNKLT
jgi:hypothetical protein